MSNNINVVQTFCNLANDLFNSELKVFIISVLYLDYETLNEKVTYLTLLPPWVSVRYTFNLYLHPMRSWGILSIWPDISNGVFQIMLPEYLRVKEGIKTDSYMSILQILTGCVERLCVYLIDIHEVNGKIM